MGPNYYSTPVAQKPSGFDKKIIFVVIGIFLALLVGIALMMLGRGTDTGDLLARAVVRQQNLLALTSEAQKNIRSADLLKVNSDAKIFLASDLLLLQSLMQEAGTKGASKEVVASESDPESAERLSQASLNGRYDAAYTAVLSQKIDAQQALLREIFGKTNNPASKQGVSTVYEKLENIQKQLDELK